MTKIYQSYFTKLFLTLMVSTAGFSTTALAHGDAAHAKSTSNVKTNMVKKEQKEWGIAGDAKSVTRTVTITMLDTMRFSPDKLDVNQGETVKIIIKNTGSMLHELVIGTKKELDEHAALMLKFQNMEHDEPYMAHVAAGKTGEIIWTFNRTGNFDFACLIAGHYQTGMVGKIAVSAKK
jgi:uncharacterized cupredoxin-like copper-binding protein